MLTQAQLMPVIVPLSKATERTLAPETLFPNDYLKIDFDKKEKKFVVTAFAGKIVDDTLFAPEDSYSTSDGVHVVRDITRVASRSAAVRWVKRVPERKEVGYGVWELAATDFTALVIRHAWPQHRIVFASDEVHNLYMMLIARFALQSRSQNILANFRMSGQLPEIPDDYVTHPDHPLSPYQLAGLMASLQTEGFNLFMETGTGKTAIVVNRVSLESARKRAGRIPGVKAGLYRVLVVCPKSLRYNWTCEFEKFSTAPGRVCALRGGSFTRTKDLLETMRDTNTDDAWAAVIVSYDSISSMLDYLKKVPFDLVVLDESHMVKHTGTDRWKAVRELRDNSRQRMCLTGTPMPNKVFDLFSQYEFLGEGCSGFSKYENFRAFHGKFGDSVSGNGPRVLVAVKNIPLLQERLSRTAFVITKEEAGLQLPPKTYDVVEVQMTKTQAEWYKKVRNELALELENFESKRLTADHVLTKLLRLAQITSGHVKWDRQFDTDGVESEHGGKVEAIPGNNPKIDEVINILKDPERDPNAKAIIWACFAFDHQAISGALTVAGIEHVMFTGKTGEQDRLEAVKRFNTDPTCKVLIGSPAAAGTGLTLVGYDVMNEDSLPTYCDLEIFFSQRWAAGERIQAEDRAHRRGTRSPVRIVDLTIPGTIDEDIRAAVFRKRQLQLQIQDVKAILRSVLERTWE